jgi:pyruvate dehydrogenase E1 component
LQHQDGTSHVIAATIPNCRAYDPAFAAELAVIVDHGARQMLEQGEDVFYYITVMNENYAQPSLPDDARDGVIRGMHCLSKTQPSRESTLQVRLLGSGAILREVSAAAEILSRDWQVSSEVWSVTSFTELAREAREVERWNRLHPTAQPRRSYVSQCIDGALPVIAATDYVSAYPQLIASFIKAPFTTLGTDGFGRSDTRAALRKFFEVDRHHIVVAALCAAAAHGSIERTTVAEAITRYEFATESPPPWNR